MMKRTTILTRGLGRQPERTPDLFDLSAGAAVAHREAATRDGAESAPPRAEPAAPAESVATGKQLRDEGIERTLKAEHAEWLPRALADLRLFAAARRDFTAEQFRFDYLSRGGPQPHSHKVWGGFMKSAATLGIVQETGMYRSAVSPKTHAHPVKVWQSLLFKDAGGAR